MDFIIILLSVGLTWLLTYNFLYSPKAQIKKLWKNIRLIKSLTPRSENIPEIIYSESDKKIVELGGHINYLLKYNFDPEKDKEYIEQNRWLTRDEQIRG